MLLAGQGSDPEGSVLSFAWSQISGPAVTIASTTDPASAVEIPEVPIGNVEPIMLSLRVTDADGATSTDTVSISVASTDYVVIRADGDADGQEELYKYDPETDSLLMLSGTIVDGGRVRSFEISPDGRWIAYVADQDTEGTTELYVAAADGTSVTKVSGPNSSHVSLFRWSPNGTQIAYFAVAADSGLRGFFLVEPNGSNIRKIDLPEGAPPTTKPYDFSWSPDSRFLAMAGSSSAVPIDSIYAYDTQATDLVSVQLSLPVASGGRVAQDFSWSPDSSLVSYRAEQSLNGVLELYVSRPDGTENTKLNPTLTTNGDVGSSRWSPDGSRILYLADQEIGSVRELYSVRPDSSENTKVNVPLKIRENVTEYSWSPDSSLILYQIDHNLSDYVDLYSARPDGSDDVGILSVETLAFFASMQFEWSPDGSRILYAIDADTDGVREIYTMRPDGSEAIKLNGVLPPEGDVQVFSPAWSSDSSRIFYVADQYTEGVEELFTVRPNASENFKVNDSLFGSDRVTFPLWSPDGSRILYMIDAGQDDLYMATPDGLTKQIISKSLFIQSFRPQYSWSP